MARILIVEDHASLARLYTFYLQSADHEVSNASTAHEGLSLYEAEHPQLVIVDISLPDMNGRDFIDQLREIDHKVKIIAMYFDATEQFSVPGDVLAMPKDSRRPQFVDCVNQKLAELDNEQNNACDEPPAVTVTTSERGTIIICQAAVDGSDAMNCLEISPEQVDGLVAWLNSSQRILNEYSG